MKKIIQLDATNVTFSQKIASAVKDFSGNIFEAAPDYLDAENLKFFDRMKSVWNQTTSTAQIGVAKFNLSEKGAGYIANSTAGSSQNFQIQSFDKNQFTFLIVAKAKSDGAQTSLLMHNTALTPTEADIVPRLQITSSGNLSFYTGTSTPRISTPIKNPLDVHIYTLTFSTSNGLKLFIDGKLSASNENDKRPLTDSFARFITLINAGMCFILSVNDDLSKLEHASKLKLIHDSLKEQYNL